MNRDIKLAAYLDLDSWRMMLGSYDQDDDGLAKTVGTEDAEVLDQSSQKPMLIIQESISPFDAYTYLQARFGDPNGIHQRKAWKNPNHIFKWDYLLKAGDSNLLIVGTLEQVHVHFEFNLDDSEYVAFIKAFKAGFKKFGREKREFTKKLEKWHLFPNQYLPISNRCAQLFENISDTIPKVQEHFVNAKGGSRTYSDPERVKLHYNLEPVITTSSTELALLTPIMFESFLGLIVGVKLDLSKFDDEKAITSFVRGPIIAKIVDLAHYCTGFETAISKDNPVFRRFQTVLNRRNDIIHGNVNPVEDAFDITYYHYLTPLAKYGGDSVKRYWIRLLQRYKPQQVLEDYLATHEFILEILLHMSGEARASLVSIMKDPAPAWNEKRGMSGTLSSDRMALTIWNGAKYEADLPPRDRS